MTDNKRPRATGIPVPRDQISELMELARMAMAERDEAREAARWIIRAFPYSEVGASATAEALRRYSWLREEASDGTN
jgi:hypothetical protein